jgi:hypothetical protein
VLGTGAVYIPSDGTKMSRENLLLRSVQTYPIQHDIDNSAAAVIGGFFHAKT